MLFLHSLQGTNMSNRVEPLRDREKIRLIKDNLLQSEKWRDYVLFVCGINFGLRIGDLLRLRIGDLLSYNQKLRSSFEIVEQKTGKRNIIPINDQAASALKLLLEKTDIDQDPGNYLIYNTRRKYHRISRVQAYNLVKRFCTEAGIYNVTIGTHSLRKTWGYLAHQAGVSIEVIQAKYMHSSTATTRHYLGIERRDVHEAYRLITS